MKDCLGKPIRMFDRVRAATKAEIEASGHEGDPPSICGEMIALPSFSPAGGDAVLLVHDVQVAAITAGSDGSAVLGFRVILPASAPAGLLVKLAEQ